MDEILDVLHHFQNPSDQRLRTKLAEITSMAVSIWSALRKDNCQVEFDYEPTTSGREEWDFVDDVATSGSIAADSPSEIPLAQLPSKSFMLFPRITGFFDPDYTTPCILHPGLILPQDSPAFRVGLQEIQHIDNATKEFRRSLRRGSSVQSSSIMDKRPGDWPASHRGCKQMGT